MWPDQAWPAWGDLALGIVLVYSLAILGQYFLLQILAFLQTLDQVRRSRIADRLSFFQDDMAPPISILVPAYNEGPTIVDSVRSLIQLQYPTFEIIVINDGSKDDTLQRLAMAFRLQPSHRTIHARVPRERLREIYSAPGNPHLLVLDVANGGKATALNIGIAMARHPLFLAIDADTVLEQETLLRLAQPFFEDPSTQVAGGVVRPSNGCRITGGKVQETGVPRSHLARLQVVEYLRGMLGGRLGWARLDSLYIVSGALGLFSRDQVLAAGGYRADTLGEDMELVMRLQRRAVEEGRLRAVQFAGNAVGWTEAPEDLGTLRRQRRRWHQGLAESLWLNRGLLLNRRVRSRHALAFGAQVSFELLGPVLEAGGYLLLFLLAAGGRLDPVTALLYLGIFLAGGVLNSLLGLALETIACPRYARTGDIAVLMIYAVLENFGYRQLTVLWRIEGLWSAIRRRKAWGTMARRGHDAGAPAGGRAGAGTQDAAGATLDRAA